MRPLTEEETRVMFEKIAKYIGENLQLLVDRPDGTYCFRLHNDRVYYVSEKILKLAANIAGDKLVSLGTCFGKFTKTHKFRLHITALDYLAPYAKVCGAAPSRPLGMEEVGEEGHPRTQIVDSDWRQHQHVERFVGSARAPGQESCDHQL
uniref:Nucleolar pre-rRNA processing protein NIP7 n=1 Tax=Myotis myotis TaxID=51298 RepID=A0A7J7SCS3_MYOMY|nr:nucleolar pre-rRNA processing protein NIP7 [Myotis myotis]